MNYCDEHLSVLKNFPGCIVQFYAYCTYFGHYQLSGGNSIFRV